MRVSKLTPGDRVERNVRGRRFTATFHGETIGGYSIDNTQPVTSYRTVSSRQIVRKLKGGVGG